VRPFDVRAVIMVAFGRGPNGLSEKGGFDLHIEKNLGRIWQFSSGVE